MPCGGAGRRWAEQPPCSTASSRKPNQHLFLHTELIPTLRTGRSSLSNAPGLAAGHRGQRGVPLTPSGLSSSHSPTARSRSRPPYSPAPVGAEPRGLCAVRPPQPPPYPRLAAPVPLGVRVRPVHGQRRVAARHGGGRGPATGRATEGSGPARRGRAGHARGEAAWLGGASAATPALTPPHRDGEAPASSPGWGELSW